MGSKILIVDDNVKNLQVIGNILKEKNYSIAIAKNGLQAIELCSKINPDLILLDIMMPEMDGFGVIDELKSMDNLKDIPVIFLTAKSETEDVVRGFEKGGVDYILKPFKKEELLARVKTHIALVNAKNKIKIQANELQQLVDVRDKMYSIIAHDLRSPLGSIKMTLQALLNPSFEFEKESFNELATMLLKSTDDTQDLLDNLLQWTQCQSGKLTSNFTEVDINAIINEVIILYKNAFDQKKIVATNSFPENIITMLDRNMIKTVIRNLVSNAIKFTP